MVINVPEWIIKEKTAKNEKVYLSDFMQLSDMYNTVFNKSVTGIGGTSLALDSDENIIILMPFKEVVNNKDGYNKDTFIVKGGVTVAKIVKYLKAAGTRKIVSTYDGLPKIIEAFEKAKIDVKNEFLLVDEWQVIFSQYIFRNPVMKYLLSRIKDFNKVCLMTATPIKKDWWFKEIQHLEELELNYTLPEVTVRHFQVPNIKDEAVAITRLHTADRNLHFFCNSVDFIKDVIKAGELKPEDVRIICSADNDKNKTKLTGFKIASTKDEVKKFNFYTSTCFEGCDIYDKNGKIYVFCDGNKTHTLIDISTTLPQIAGRIRDIKDGSIDLIYKSSRYINVTKAEFEQAIEYNKNRAKELLKTWELNADVLDLDKLNSYYLNGEVVENPNINYSLKEKNTIIKNLEYDETLLNLDNYNFEVNHTYSIKANLIQELSDSFIPVTVIKPWAEQLEEIEKEKIKRMTFKEKVQAYIKLKDSEFAYMPEFEKVVIDAVNVLGIERIESLNYHKGHIEQALIAKSDISESNKIMRLLIKNGFTIGQIFTNAECKAKLTEIYTSLGIKKAATATQIKNYFDTLPTKVVRDEKRVDAYKIIRPLIIFNSNE